jgi:hypothetical protein
MSTDKLPSTVEIPCVYEECSGFIVVDVARSMRPGFVASCNVCGRRIESEGRVDPATGKLMGQA